MSELIIVLAFGVWIGRMIGKLEGKREARKAGAL